MTWTVKEIMTEFGVSEVTARRHLRKGCIPSPERRLGKDGKTYPAPGRAYYDPEWRRLSTARSALRHADKEKGLSDCSMDTIKEIRQLCNGILEGRERLFSGEWRRRSVLVDGEWITPDD